MAGRLVDIPSTPADGNTRTVIVTAIADTRYPTAAELNAGVDISCYLTKGGFQDGTDQATIPDDRSASIDPLALPGAKTHSLTITGIDNTNSDVKSDNALVEALVEGRRMFAVKRRGKPWDQLFMDGDIVKVIPFMPGQKQEVQEEANSVTRSTWPCFVTGQVWPTAEVGA
jgi:hypothetical protein